MLPISMTFCTQYSRIRITRYAAS